MNLHLIKAETQASFSAHAYTTLTNYEKGKLFEDFVEKLFNQRSGRFIPVKHDSKSALIFGLTAARASYPDLKFLFKSKYQKYQFAVECKWRKSFDDDGKIVWAGENQIKNYLEFQRCWNIPVFVAIGIGGHPSDPAQLYVTPLHIIGNNINVCKNELLLYNRNKNRRFFYDVRQIKLF